MIKAILADLDGTICTTKDIHFESLNKAISEVAPSFVIDLNDHLLNYNGLPTKRKLELLESKGMDWKLSGEIYKRKQQYTDFFIRKLISPDDYKLQRECLSKLKDDGYKLGCCSNAIKSSVYTMLLCSVGTDLFDVILSNEDCEYPKPNPSMYLLAMSRVGVSPSETLVIEDSEVGILAAKLSSACVMRVDGPQDIVYEKIVEYGQLEYLRRL